MFEHVFDVTCYCTFHKHANFEVQKPTDDWVLSLPSIILTELLGNKILLSRVQKVMVCDLSFVTLDWTLNVQENILSTFCFSLQFLYRDKTLRVCFLSSFFPKFWRGQIVPLTVFLRDNFNCSAGLAQWRGLAQTLFLVIKFVSSCETVHGFIGIVTS